VFKKVLQYKGKRFFKIKCGVIVIYFGVIATIFSLGLCASKKPMPCLSLAVLSDRVSLKIAAAAKKNASRNKIRLAFFVYAFN
jgi:hypothetical protein